MGKERRKGKRGKEEGGGRIEQRSEKRNTEKEIGFMDRMEMGDHVFCRPRILGRSQRWGVAHAHVLGHILRVG
jgi:hypothetical protein